jgi:tetratricopeptide (TPR) repeat protein
MFWKKKPQPPPKIAAGETLGAPDRGEEDAPDLLQGAQQQLQFGLYQAALASFERVLRLDGTLVAAWEGKGAALRQLKRFEEANQAVEMALQLQINPLTLDYAYWFERGNQRANLGQFEAAIASYDTALKIQPDKHEVWHNRGTALDKLGEYEAAIASYDKALKIQPDDHETWNNCGVVLVKLGQLEVAIASYDKALQIR